MRILITGSAGLIGADAVRAFVRTGVEVLPLVRRTTDHAETPPAIPLDLRDAGAVAALVAMEPSLIVHAAGVLPIAFEGDQAVSAGHENRALDDVVLAATAALGCPLIYVSSTSLYGCVQTLCSEDSPLTPRGPYGEEKYRSECRVLELDGHGIVLRVSAPYGSQQRSWTVLRKFVQQASRGENLFYYGTGAREQDFTAVEDISAAIVTAAAALRSGVFNIASGKPITMKELADLVIATVGSPTSNSLPAGIDDPEEHCRSRIAILKAERELHWRPVVELVSGIRRLASELARTATSQSGNPASDAPSHK